MKEKEFTVQRDSKGRWLPGRMACPPEKRKLIPGHPWRFQPGQSGNPLGVGKLRARFEQWFFSEMTDPKVAADAFDALKAALRAREPWAHAIYWQRMLPADALNVKVSRGTDDERFDYTKLSDAELEALERILERAHVADAPLEIGEGEAASTDVR